MTTEELIAALEYICQPDQPEYPNGFHPQTREAARAALKQLEILEARAVKAEARVKGLEGRILVNRGDMPYECPPGHDPVDNCPDCSCNDCWQAWLLSEDQP